MTPGMCVGGHAYGELPGCHWCGRLSYYKPVKPLIIGEQPSKNGNPDTPVSGRIGERLAEFMGITYMEYDMLFERVNLLPIREEYTGSGKEWDADRAKARAIELSAAFESGQVVLLLGKRASTAFGLSDEYFLRHKVNGADVYVIPHPSGLNRWYNDESNKLMAQEFLRAIIERVYQ